MILKITDPSFANFDVVLDAFCCGVDDAIHEWAVDNNFGDVASSSEGDAE